VIFLTGGSVGIGWDCAKAYAAEGAKVVIVASGKEAVAKAAAELGAKHLGLHCDMSLDEQVKTAVKKTLARYGRLDAVHNNAGIATP
jgi:meso-butanediol dehydrogenase/(S,S)-butanediol dehydrogenase/diacetyl reductase